MKAAVKWKEKMEFVGEASGISVALDSKPPLGLGKGITPKEALLLGIAGCTAMDVVALMRKHKQELSRFEVSVDAGLTGPGKHPVVFDQVKLKFQMWGQVDSKKLMESVELSQTKYCGVSAMVSKAVHLGYEVFLNDSKIGEGVSHFDF